jgi:hypothetical protein
MSAAMPVIRICQRCLSRGHQQRSLVTSANGSARPMPLRIFATENDLDDDGYCAFDNNATGEVSKEEKQRRYGEWLERRNTLVSSNERLATDFRKRVGKYQPAGLIDALEAVKTPTGTTMLSRMRRRSDRSLAPLLQVTPGDLIQTQENVETKNTIIADIESCISAAVHRLELYPSQDHSNPHPKNKITIPYDQYTWLSSILQFQFTKYQLIDYGQKSGLKKSHLLKIKIPEIINVILDRIWNLEKEPELPPDETLVTKSMSVSMYLINLL